MPTLPILQGLHGVSLTLSGDTIFVGPNAEALTDAVKKISTATVKNAFDTELGPRLSGIVDTNQVLRDRLKDLLIDHLDDERVQAKVKGIGAHPEFDQQSLPGGIEYIVIEHVDRQLGERFAQKLTEEVERQITTGLRGLAEPVSLELAGLREKHFSLCRATDFLQRNWTFLPEQCRSIGALAEVAREEKIDAVHVEIVELNNWKQGTKRAFRKDEFQAACVDAANAVGT